MTEKKKLSKYKDVYCLYCHTPIVLDLAERRGDKEVYCPSCESHYKISALEEFIGNLSNTTEGQCPNCLVMLEFGIIDRVGKKLITCPACKDSFYLNEVILESSKRNTIEMKTENNNLENEVATQENHGNITAGAPVMLKNYKTYVALGLFLDFFFIFTILTFSEEGKIKKEIDKWQLDDKLSFNTWRTIFRAKFVLIAIFIVISILDSIYV